VLLDRDRLGSRITLRSTTKSRLRLNSCRASVGIRFALFYVILVFTGKVKLNKGVETKSKLLVKKKEAKKGMTGVSQLVKVDTKPTVDVKEVIEVIETMKGWIDSVPKDTILPVMPGFDRDWVDSVLQILKQSGLKK
jgi:hypothetical protein